MSSLPGIIGLILFVYVRPQEFFVALKEVNFLYIFIAISIAGIAYGISQRRLVLAATPHLKWVLLFGLWAIFTIAIRKPSILSTRAVGIAVDLVLYLVIAHGIQDITTFKRVLAVVFASGLFVAYVGADQGLSPFQCVVYNPAERNSNGFADGRECKMVEDDGTPHDGQVDCIAEGQPGMPYQCERAGLFGTTSVGGGRVRYLGVLLDPNELALATALCVPFTFAFLEMRRSFLRLALLVLTLIVVAVEIVFTQSRGGQVVFGAVLGAYFIKKYGWKRGLIVGAALAVPMLMVGGRHDESADESTLERLGCSAAGIKMMLSYPFTGVGLGEFTEYHNLTAHNAYVLACGELGLPGMFLFGALMYLAIKVPYSILRYPMPDAYETAQIKALAMGLLAALVGAAIGIFFLSWCYHFVLWIHLGLVGALYACTRRLFPSFDCRLSRKEMVGIFFGYIGLLIVWTGYIKHKGAWG